MHGLWIPQELPKERLDPISRIVGFDNLSLHRKGRDSRLATHPRQHYNHHRLSLPTRQDQLQGKNLVSLVCWGYPCARRSLETLRSARSYTPCLRCTATILSQRHRAGRPERQGDSQIRQARRDWESFPVWPHQNQAERRWKRDAKRWKMDRWEWKTYQTKSKETCLQSNRAIRTSQRLSISDFCEFLQKSEIESLFSCSYRQFIVLLQKDFWNNKCKVDNLTITIWFIQARKSSYFCSLSYS